MFQLNQPLQQYTVAFETLRSNHAAASGYLKDRYGADNQLQAFNNLTRLMEASEMPKRIPIELMSQGITALAENLGEPNLGLNMVDYLESEQNQIVLFIKETQMRFLELIQMIARYTCIATEVFEFRIVETSEHIELELSPNSPATVSYHQYEGVMGLIVRSLRHCKEVELLGVDLPHSKPSADDTPYFTTFGLLPNFDEPKASIYFAHQSRKAMVVGTADAKKSLRSLQRFEIQYMQHSDQDCLVERSRFLLPLLLCHGQANKERLAELLCVSSRTLQRRLKEQGTSFRALLQDLRIQLAEKHFRYTDTSCSELGFALGYQDYKQFHRAFKSWFGITPEQYRMQIAS